MNAEQVEEMRKESPREFDAAVAEHVHGWLRFGTNTPQGRGSYWLDDPDPDKRFGPYEPSNPNALLLTDEACRGRQLYHDAMRPVPHYSTDPAADYATLVKVRDDWGEIKLWWAFNDRLRDIWRSREVDHHEHELHLFYQPGDYSAAALDSVPTPHRQRRDAGEQTCKMNGSQRSGCASPTSATSTAAASRPPSR